MPTDATIFGYGRKLIGHCAVYTALALVIGAGFFSLGAKVGDYPNETLGELRFVVAHIQNIVELTFADRSAEISVEFNQLFTVSSDLPDVRFLVDAGRLFSVAALFCSCGVLVGILLGALEAVPTTLLFVIQTSLLVFRFRPSDAYGSTADAMRDAAEFRWPQRLLAVAAIAIAAYLIVEYGAMEWVFSTVVEAVLGVVYIVVMICKPILMFTIWGLPPLWSLVLGTTVICFSAFILYKLIIVIAAAINVDYASRLRFFVTETIPDTIQGFTLISLLITFVRMLYNNLLALLSTAIRALEHFSRMFQDAVHIPLIYTSRWAAAANEKFGKRVDELLLEQEREHLERLKRWNERKKMRLQQRMMRRQYRAESRREWDDFQRAQREAARN